MIDLATLITFLETDPAFDADVRGGSNGVIHKRLNTGDGALPRRWRAISAVDFLDAIASESLTVQQEERIRTYAAEGRAIPIHKQGVRTWIQAQGFSVSTMQALRDLSEVEGKPADVFLGDDDESIILRNVREAVKQIPKAAINQPGNPTIPTKTTFDPETGIGVFADDDPNRPGAQ